MKKRIICILIIVINFTTYAQTENYCTNTLNKLISKVEKEYPGFHTKTKDPLAYKSFKSNLLNLSRTSPDDSCYNLLKTYISYFRDGHLVVYKNNTGTISVKNKQIKTNTVDIKNFYKYAENSRDSIEGIWQSDNYKIGVVKSGGSYEAFIISSKNEAWKPNEIKFTLFNAGKADYYLGDHSQSNDTYTLINNCILYFNSSKAAFVKEIPKPLMSSEKISEMLNLLEGFYIKELSKKTLLLRVARFDPAYTKRIEKLIDDNKNLLSTHANLIIDVRGNGGGTDHSIRPILPYIYSNPIRYLGGEYLVTQTLIDGLKNYAENVADKVKDSADIAYVKRTLGRMEGKIGQFIPYSESAPYGFTEQDSVYSFPKSVGILIDGQCGSTTEKFIFDARQSKKVKLFGTPTYGAIDYVSIRRFEFGSNDFYMMIPTIRAMRLINFPLDNIGIQPDIYMDKFIGDWVQYAKEYLEK